MINTFHFIQDTILKGFYWVNFSWNVMHHYERFRAAKFHFDLRWKIRVWEVYGVDTWKKSKSEASLGPSQKAEMSIF